MGYCCTLHARHEFMKHECGINYTDNKKFRYIYIYIDREREREREVDHQHRIGSNLLMEVAIRDDTDNTCR